MPVELNFKQYGQGEPVIILHGLLGSLDNWQTIAKQMAEKRMIFTLDLRNHGHSPHTDDINFDLMVEDLRHFMESQHIFKATLIGHSLGGKVVMQMALEQPDMVEKLVVVDMAPVVYKPHHQQIFEGLRSIDFNKVSKRQEVDEQLAEYIKEQDVRLFLMKGLYRKDGGFAWRYNLEALYEHYDDLMQVFETDEQYDGETLFLRGGNSNYVKDEYKETIAKNFPNYEIATIANAGHWVHAEQPDEFIKIVEGFLD